MGTNSLSVLFSDLSTPLVADACLRLGLSLRLASPGIRPIRPDLRLAGRVLPVRHYGSVDVFLEALGRARPGDVMVVDNGGRSDEGCIGDLIALEAKAAGMGGMAVWGVHRDTPFSAMAHAPPVHNGWTTRSRTPSTGHALANGSSPLRMLSLPTPTDFCLCLQPRRRNC